MRHVPVWLVLGLNRGWGQFKNFLCTPIIFAKSVFFTIDASLLWLNNVSGVYLFQVSLLLFGQQCLGHFFRYRPVLPIGCRTVQIVRQRRRKVTNTWPSTLNAIPTSSNQQANSLLSWHNYTGTRLVISGNDKNKQLTL